jgi:hypothetical protein
MLHVVLPSGMLHVVLPSGMLHVVLPSGMLHVVLPSRSFCRCLCSRESESLVQGYRRSTSDSQFKSSRDARLQELVRVFPEGLVQDLVRAYKKIGSGRRDRAAIEPGFMSQLVSKD